MARIVTKDMRRRFFYTIILALITFTLKAEGYRILVKWEGLPDSSIFLAHYYDTSIYIDDTLKLDSKGEGVFEGEKPLHEGLYVMYQSGNNYFDFLLGTDQTMTISTNQIDVYGNLIISSAPESEKFLVYQQMLKQKTVEKNELSAGLNSENKEEQEKARKRIEEIDQDMLSFIEQETRNDNKNMYNVFLRTANQIVLPEPPFDTQNPSYDSLAWFYTYNYRRDHFLDGIDFTDDRVLYTPVIKTKMDTYFNKLLIQNPDSIIKQAFKVLKASEPNQKMYQYTTQFFLNNSLQSKIMGMDAVFVAIADEVYLKRKASWADSTTLAKIAEEVYLTRPNLIGKKAPDLVMENIDGEYESLYLSQADYTILVFYEYDCGHCKKDIPELYNDVYLKLLEHNVEVYAVCMNDEKEKWKEFVETNNLAGWHHLWDPKHHSQFRFKYNVKTSPTLYLIDKDKKIVAKKLDNTNLSKLLSLLLKEK